MARSKKARPVGSAFSKVMKSMRSKQAVDWMTKEKKKLSKVSTKRK